MIVYTTQHDNRDHPTPEAAALAIEARGHGTVVEFSLSPNMPGRLPAMVASSCASWVYEDGVWYSCAIHDGHGGRIAVERPNSR